MKIDAEATRGQITSFLRAVDYEHAQETQRDQPTRTGTGRTVSRFLARVIIFLVGPLHTAGLAASLWLDEQVVKDYLDGIARSRQELDR